MYNIPSSTFLNEKPITKIDNYQLDQEEQTNKRNNKKTRKPSIKNYNNSIF